MNDVDHRAISRFQRDTHPGYIQVGNYLCELKEAVIQANGPNAHGLQPVAQVRRQTLVGSQEDVTNENGSTSTPQQNQVTSSPHEQLRQQPPASSIQAGSGQGGEIFKQQGRLVIGGGKATGASMNSRDLANFLGVVEGGTGTGATIRTAGE
jgi:hypothetical protein